MLERVWRKGNPLTLLVGKLHFLSFILHKNFLGSFFSASIDMKVKVKSPSRVQLLETPWTATHQVPPSTGFSRQAYWSGSPFPSPVHESEVAQSCPTLHNPMDCSLPGSSVHGIFLARGLEWGAIALSVNYHGILQKVNSQQLLISLNFSVSGLYFTDRLYAVLQSSEIKLLYYLDKIGCI